MGNKNTMLILALVGGGAALWYFSRNTATAAPPVTTTPANPVTTPLGPAPAPVSTTTTTAVQNSPVVATPLQIQPVAIASYPGISNDQGATLDNWAATSLTPGNLAQWNAMKGYFTAAEWQGLADIYFNDWVGGQGNTDARTTFWDNWRTKYHILDGTY